MKTKDQSEECPCDIGITRAQCEYHRDEESPKMRVQKLEFTTGHVTCAKCGGPLSAQMVQTASGFMGMSYGACPMCTEAEYQRMICAR